MPLIRPTATDCFEHSDWQADAIRNDPNLDGRQRVELLLLLDSLTSVALAARGVDRPVLTSRPAPTPVKARHTLWLVQRGELTAVA